MRRDPHRGEQPLARVVTHHDRQPAQGAQRPATPLEQRDRRERLVAAVRKLVLLGRRRVAREDLLAARRSVLGRRHSRVMSFAPAATNASCTRPKLFPRPRNELQELLALRLGLFGARDLGHVRGARREHRAARDSARSRDRLRAVALFIGIRAEPRRVHDRHLPRRQL
ncbi:hypothetical protein [Sorangium sp. So ce124]|uniref:hypothetical protein n=1 Tax=Sorangium sp. So ce124 TaxID=3133280 RepID=UPI003F5D6FA7